MFTLKFYRHYSDSSKSLTCISSPHYQAYTRTDGSVSITIYKDFLKVDGVDYQVNSNDGYDVCFVENYKGKTIERYSSDDHKSIDVAKKSKSKSKCRVEDKGDNLNG